MTTKNNSKVITKAPPTPPIQPPKYDLPWLQSELRNIIDILLQDDTIKSKAQLFRNYQFSSTRFYRYISKYNDNKRVQEYTKKIDEILESRLIEHGLTGKNFAFVIFLLKNHYNYQDKREVETETTHVFKVARGNKVIDIKQTEVKQLLNRPIAPNQQG